MVVAVLAIVAGVVGSLATLAGTVYMNRRSTRGSLDTSTAADVWSGIRAQVELLTADNTALRAERAVDRAEIVALRSETAVLRARVNECEAALAAAGRQI